MLLAVLLAAVALAAVPPAASSQTNAPPGNSEVDQYFETVPSGSGAVGTRRDGAGKADAVPPTVRRELEELGPEGRLAADLAAANPPRSRGDRPASTSRLRLREEPGEGPVAAVVRALGGTGEDGMGIALPLILAAGLLMGAVALLSRRRRAL